MHCTDKWNYEKGNSPVSGLLIKKERGMVMRRHVLQKMCALALAGTMVLSLGACGSAETGAAGTQAAQSEASGENAPADASASSEGTSELYWFSDVSGWGPATANWSTKESPATEYIEENFGLTLKIEQPPTDATTKLGLMIASGELPDMMSITDADIYKQLVAADKVWDMKTFLETYDPESHLLKDFPEDIKQALTDTYGAGILIPAIWNPRITGRYSLPMIRYGLT